jgi:hypothetical protein
MQTSDEILIMTNAAHKAWMEHRLDMSGPTTHAVLLNAFSIGLRALNAEKARIVALNDSNNICRAHGGDGLPKDCRICHKSPDSRDMDIDDGA